ncbi:MAG: zinc-binding dehydrogenase [Phycisphaerae bacterium]
MIPEKMSSIIFKTSPARWAACKALGWCRPGVYVSRLGGLRIREMPVPPLPSEDWLLCQTLLGGICGTDMNMVYMQQHPGSMLKQFISWPIFLGHENVARIVQTGQRVLIDPPISCAARKIDPLCPPCQEGKSSICWNFDRGSVPAGLGLGYNNFTGGSWSPYFVAHRNQVHVLPDEIPDEQAILIDPVSCSLHAVLRDIPATGEKILVFGTGIIGLGVTLALRALNLAVDITATVRNQHQADLAKRCGADRVVFWKKSGLGDAREELAEITNARSIRLPFRMRFLQGGFDRLYDCTGKIDGLVEAQRLLRSGGRIIIAGTPQLGLIDLTCLWFRELTLIGATGRTVEKLPGQNIPQHNYRHVMDLIQQGKLDLSPLPVALYRQQDYRRALGDMRKRNRNGGVKSAFDFR